MKKPTSSQLKALRKLINAGGSVAGRDGWANGNCVNSLYKKGLARYVATPTPERRYACATEITEDGRLAVYDAGEEP